MNNWQYASKLPTSPWRGQMSVPRQLSLINDENGLAAKQTPVLAPLREDKSAMPVSANSKERLEPPFELDLKFDPGDEQVFGIRLKTDDQHWTEIGFDRESRQFYMDRTKSGTIVAAGFASRTSAPLATDRPFDLTLIVDRSSIEAYAQNGTIAMTNLIFPESPSSKIELFSKSGKPVAAKGTTWKLHSIWK